MKIYIICVDDEPEVLEAIERDLGQIEDTFPLETAENADETRQVISKIQKQGDALGLILCDHLMPGENGVDLLVSLQGQPETEKTRKVLVTGQAGLEATVEAVNRGNLNYYIAKPWSGEKLLEVVREQLTEYILNCGINPMPYLGELNNEKLMKAIHERGIISDE